MTRKPERKTILDLEKRNFTLEGTARTSVSLERAYWSAIDAIAKRRNVRWQQFVAIAVRECPATVPWARWLRVAVVKLLSDRLREATQFRSVDQQE